MSAQIDRRSFNQSVNGTQANNAFHNLNLLRGKIGKAGCGSLEQGGGRSLVIGGRQPERNRNALTAFDRPKVRSVLS